MDPIKGIVDNAVENMFSDAVKEYRLMYGDVTPDDVLEIDKAKEIMYNVLRRFVDENKS